jgi:hypothetical protein
MPDSQTLGTVRHATFLNVVISFRTEGFDPGQVSVRAIILLAPRAVNGILSLLGSAQERIS